MSEEIEVIEDSELISLVKGWSGNLKEIKTLYTNKKSNNQVEVLLDKNGLLDFAKYIKSKGWEYVTSLSGVDYPDRSGEELEVVSHFANFESPKIIVVKARCSYEDPKMPSLYPVVKSVNFHERETHDLFGIKFVGHVKDENESGELPVLMLPEDWPQTEDDPPFPFRKEYVQIPRPFEKVTDTRGHLGEQDKDYHRPIDRSGWLDEYYKEDSPIKTSHTKKKNRLNKSADDLSEVEDKDSEYSKKERKHF